MERQTFLEGLSRLPSHITSIDFHQENFLWAGRGTDLAIEQIIALPEYKQWRDFQAAICDELFAVSEIGRTFDLAFPCCRKLAIAIRDGMYKSGSGLILEAVTEVDSALFRLSEFSEKSRVPVSKLDMRNLFGVRDNRTVKKMLDASGVNYEEVGQSYIVDAADYQRISKEHSA